MSSDATDDRIQEMLLVRSVEEFLIHEAELLDDGRYREWLGLLDDDILYRAPIRTNRKTDGRVDPEEGFWFDDVRGTLELRVRRLETDVSWAEEPPSRTRRIVSNVRVETRDQIRVAVRSNLICYRNRGHQRFGDVIAAQRNDELRRNGDGWLLAAREIRFDHATLSTKNLALLF